MDCDSDENPLSPTPTELNMSDDSQTLLERAHARARRTGALGSSSGMSLPLETPVQPLSRSSGIFESQISESLDDPFSSVSSPSVWAPPSAAQSERLGAYADRMAK